MVKRVVKTVVKRVVEVVVKQHAVTSVGKVFSIKLLLNTEYLGGCIVPIREWSVHTYVLLGPHN